MTINQKLWGKVVLSAYNYLERLCGSLDSLIEKTAVNSYYTSSINANDYSIETISRKIIEYSNRKIGYINLKLIIEKALKGISEQESKLLILKFIQKMPIEKACNLLKISKRSSYRKLERALAKFVAMLVCLGYTTEKLELEYSSDPFICSILALIKRNNYLIDEKANVITNGSIFNNYVNELMSNAI